MKSEKFRKIIVDLGKKFSSLLVIEKCAGFFCALGGEQKLAQLRTC